MSLLGIDVGTTGVKIAAFDPSGKPLAHAYREFTIEHPKPGYAELDSFRCWSLILDALSEVCSGLASDPPAALSVSSLGEAVVPVSNDRQVLGNSILNFDMRGSEYVEPLRARISDAELFHLNGNIVGNHYGLTKLMHIADKEPDLYAKAHKFLPWGSFVSFMLGSDPVVDYSLANRLLLFDVNSGSWSPKMLRVSGIDPTKLPSLSPAGSIIGSTSKEFVSCGLPEGTAIVAGGHDQCMNAIGCGVIDEGQAMYGMGTFLCAVPVYSDRPQSAQMLERGLNVEHHTVPNRYVSFLYNQGGSLLKWYRDTFAGSEAQAAKDQGRSIYAELLREMPNGPSGLMVIPHFTVTGPPRYLSDSCGMIAGLTLETTRGQIAKAVLEGATFYMRNLLELFESMGFSIQSYNAVGGGASSDAWLQLSADVIGKSFARPEVTEAGALGAAINAGIGLGIYRSPSEAVASAVRINRCFEPDANEHARYQDWFSLYKEAVDKQSGFLRKLKQSAR